MQQDYDSKVEALNRLLPKQSLGVLARVIGFVQRARLVSASQFVWAVVLSRFHSGRPGFAESLRCYEQLTKKRIASRPFQARFRCNQAVLFFERAFERIVAPWHGKERRRPNHPLARWFSDVVITDGTILQLQDELAGPFPGLRKIAAGMKITLTISLFGLVPLHVRITESTKNDTKLFPPLKLFRRGTLFLFDLGYLAYRRFESLSEAGHFYLCRQKKNGNALIIGVRRAPKYVKEALRKQPGGVSLRRLLPTNKRIDKAWDLDVLLRNDEKGGKKIFSRMVIVPGPKQMQRAYLTNLPKIWNCHALPEVYRLRWQIELVFKELKQHLNLETLPSKNQYAVQVFAWASLIALALSRCVTSALYPVQCLLGLRAQIQPIAVTRALRSCLSLLVAVLNTSLAHIRRIAKLFVDEILLQAQNLRTERNDSCRRLQRQIPCLP